ncbi:hypothetical protein TorRG33x02_348200 [Trema orientale]|uniref:Uncharacterized protein n=1 Tax=Trema orientale TaxID=63057 RepID=A0A2P5AKI8_TREOI|nr:hypothetical protein TorRG33x02_348200 [Trema orientale]
MGVSFPAIAFRAPSQRHREAPAATTIPGPVGSRGCKKPKKRTAASSSAVVAERRRRRFGDGAFYGAAAELEGVMVDHDQQRNGRLLFADGRVLPPAEADETTSTTSSSTSGVLCRFPVSLTGICSGGVG